MLNKQVFRTIQSGKEKEWYAAVTDAALYMATGGFLKEANELLSALWKYNLDHDRTTWMADNAFQTLWHAANEWPAFFPFDKIDIDEHEFEFRKYCTMADSITITNITTLLAGMDLSALGIGNIESNATQIPSTNQRPSFYAAIKNGKMPTAEMELKSLSELEKALENTEEMHNSYFCDIASLAAELAAKNNQQVIATKIAKLWAFNYHERSLGYSFSKMANNRHVAPLLLQGMLAEELYLTKDKCSIFVSEATAKIAERMANGDSLVYGNLSWKTLLRKLSALSIKKDPDLFTEEQKKDKWIGLKPATTESIQAAEKRLGIELPQDYKDFLLVSNGLFQFPILNPALSPIEKTDRLKPLYFQTYGSYEIFEIIKEYADEEEDTIAEYVESAICISELPAEQEIWLIPPTKKTKHWETWFFAAWVPGENRYNSFRHFIEEVIQNLEGD